MATAPPEDHKKNGESAIPAMKQDRAEFIEMPDGNRIAVLKHRILLCAMPVGAIASLGALLNLDNLPGATIVDEITHGLMSTILILLTLVLYFRPQHSFIVMVLCIVTLAGGFGLRVLMALYGPNSEMPLEQVFPPVYGFVPLIFVLTFVVAPRRTALWLSLIFYIVTGAAVAIYVASHLELFKTTPMLGVIAQQYVIAHGLYIALLYIIPLIQREYEEAVVTMKNVEREQRLDALERAQHDRLDLALSASKMGIWQWSVPDDALVWDRRMHRLLGLSEEGFENQHRKMADLTRLIVPEDQRIQREKLEQVLDQGDVLETQFRVLTQNQGLRYLAIRGRVYRDKRSQPMRMAGVCWDVTEQENRRLELERSNQDLTQFAFVASHDLREPMRGIRGFTELLQRRLDDKLDDQSREYMEFISTGIARANDMIEGLLDYSNAGNKQQNLSMTDCEKVMAQVRHNLVVLIEENHAQIDCPRPLPRVWADAQQLTRLLQNLIANAIYYRKPDVVPRITVEAEQKGTEWLFSVTDNGIGIDKGNQQRIFQIFKRLDKSTTGTGIGLAICKKIVAQHGGHIFVESEPGQGASFRFTLPYTPGDLSHSDLPPET